MILELYCVGRVKVLCPLFHHLNVPGAGGGCNGRSSPDPEIMGFG